MATLTPGYTFTSGEVVTPTKLNSAAAPTLVPATITNADIATTAAIADTKLATITTPGKVSGAAISGDIATGNLTATGNVTGAKVVGRLADGTLNVVSATVTMTSANPVVVTWTGHNLKNGDLVEFSTTGALPTAITASAEYYVVNVATNTFQISATSGGTALDTTAGTQSGVHTARFGRGAIENGFVTTNKIADASITTAKLAGNVDQLATAWVFFDGDIADSAVAGAVFTRLTATKIQVTRSTGHGLVNGNWITFNNLIGFYAFLNGTWEVENATATTFEFNLAGTAPWSSTVAFIASNANITWTGHTLKTNQVVTFSNAGGVLPTGITAGVNYYVVSVATNTFQVSASSGGAVITPSTAGTGTQTALTYITATTPSAAVTITTANPAVITWTGHALAVGQTVTFSTTGTLPTGITAGETYFVKTATAGTTFTISLTSGGTAIATTAAGTGVHTATLTGAMTSQIFSPVAIKRKYNISKIARTGLGIYRVFFATQPLTVDYISLGSAASTSGAAVGLVGATTQTLAYAQIITTNYAGTAANFDGIRFVVFGG